MLNSHGSTRWPHAVVDACVSFLALHGAFNLVVPTAVATTLRVYALVAVLTLLVAVIGRWVLKPKGASRP
jgi:hypothetical protein